MCSTLGFLLQLGRPSVDNKFDSSWSTSWVSLPYLKFHFHHLREDFPCHGTMFMYHWFWPSWQRSVIRSKKAHTLIYQPIKRTPFHVHQFVVWAISNEPVSCKSCPFYSTVLWQLTGLENLWIAISLSVGAIKCYPNCELEGSKLKIAFTTVYGTWPVVRSYLSEEFPLLPFLTVTYNN